MAGEAAVKPVKNMQKLPGAIGSTISLSAKGAACDPPQHEPFRVGDVISIAPFPWRYRVTCVEGDRVDFERIS